MKAVIHESMFSMSQREWYGSRVAYPTTYLTGIVERRFQAIALSIHGVTVEPSEQDAACDLLVLTDGAPPVAQTVDGARDHSSMPRQVSLP